MSSYHTSCSVLFIFSLFLFVILVSSAAITVSSSCLEKCGGIAIPFPFGVGEGCYLDSPYEIECKSVSEIGVPFLVVSGKEVVNISLPSLFYDGSVSSNGSLIIRSPITRSNVEQFRSLYNLTWTERSKWFQPKEYAQLELQWSFRTINISYITSLGCQNSESCLCSYGNDSASCGCKSGYDGNPYVLHGCQDIDECVNVATPNVCDDVGHKCVNILGSYACKPKFSIDDLTLYELFLYIIAPCLLLLVAVVGLCIFIIKRIHINRRNNFFKRNGGLLLEQRLTSTASSVETTRVFRSKELAKATDHFSNNRVLGEGGQGKVYKGMLMDGRIVAVKKSSVVDEDKLHEFINEMVILSQTSHPHIVKLLGFCLETEVPLLVYEYVSNGNLFEHIHDEAVLLTWEKRLGVAIEIAKALYYLHSTASIYHRDVKATNIMIDDNFRAKVADFGMSRSVPEDQTHITTVNISGTNGYLDPEYYQSSHYTDKSDVYSYGVVLLELITGEKPYSFSRSPEIRSLASYFNRTMKEKRVVDIIDARIKDESKIGQVMAVAHVARKCLGRMRRKRPDMRQVLLELEMIRSSPEDMEPPHAYVSEDDQEEEGDFEVYIGLESRNNTAFTAPASSQYNVAASTSCLEVEPLFPRRQTSL